MAKAKIGTGNNVPHSDQKLEGVDVVPTQSILNLRQGFTPKLFATIAKDNNDSDSRISHAADGLWPDRKTGSEKQSGEPTPVKGLKKSGSGRGEWHAGISRDGTHR
jgi:hypothetical protein